MSRVHRYNARRLESWPLTPERIEQLVRAAQLGMGLEPDGYLGPITETALDGRVPAAPVAPSAGASAVAELPPVVDRRHDARPKWATWRRPWRRITGIVLHQTACRLGERPARWDTVGAHWGITARGQRIRLHPSDMRVVHAQRYSDQCVGIEVDGLFEGIEGDPRTLWDDPSTPHREKASELTEAAIAATCQVIRDIASEVGEHGGAIKVIVPHRQASVNRRNDPGSAIWKRIAMPMIAELRLGPKGDGGIGWEVGGLPIPEEWDPRHAGIKY